MEEKNYGKRMLFGSRLFVLCLLHFCHVSSYQPNVEQPGSHQALNSHRYSSASSRRIARSTSLDDYSFDYDSYESSSWDNALTNRVDPRNPNYDKTQSEKDRKEFMMETSRVLDNLLQDYDNRLRPSFGGAPIQVNVTLHVDSLGPISETEMSYRVDFAFRQYWRDERLTFETTMNQDITLSHEFLGKIWLPGYSLFSLQIHPLFHRKGDESVFVHRHLLPGVALREQAQCDGAQHPAATLSRRNCPLLIQGHSPRQMPHEPRKLPSRHSGPFFNLKTKPKKHIMLTKNTNLL